jgi:hypothetical protein
MRQKIDPTERALDAYFQLDDAQKRIFVAAAIKHVERYSGTTCETPVAPKRGRPKGSRNVAPDRLSNMELREPNAAAKEGL